MKPATTHIQAFAAVFLLAVGTAGCGLSKGNDDSARASTNASETEEADTTDRSTTDEPTGTRTDPDQALARREASVAGEPIVLEVVQLERSGDTTALTFRLSAEAGAGEVSAIGAQVSQTFDDGVGEVAQGSGGDTSTLDGISLIDTENRQRYLVARDSEGVCVCDGALGSRFIEAGAPVLMSATFGAPPEDVSSVDLVIPQFGTFKDVPLS